MYTPDNLPGVSISSPFKVLLLCFLCVLFFHVLRQDAFRPKNSPKIGEIWTTQSFISTNGRDQEYGILFAADIQGDITVGIDDLQFNVVNMSFVIQGRDDLFVSYYLWAARPKSYM